MLGAPKVKAIRGFSDFGFSYVYVIFEEGTDLYWARSRMLEYLSKIQPRLARRAFGRSSDPMRRASAGSSSTRSSTRAASTRSRTSARSRTGTFATTSSPCPGVAEVASLGGFVRQYQVTVDPNRLSAYGSPAHGGRRSDPRLQQRGRRPARRVERRRVHGPRPRLHPSRSPTSKRSSSRPTNGERRSASRDVAEIQLGPEIRRGIAELDGEGEVAAGVVVMRHGENAMNVIERVKERLKAIEPTLPGGRQDRHDLRPLGADRTVDQDAEARARSSRCSSSRSSS